MTKTVDKKVVDCTTKELRQHLRLYCGVDAKESWDKARLMAEMQKVWEKPTIPVAVEGEAEAEPAAETKTETAEPTAQPEPTKNDKAARVRFETSGKQDPIVRMVIAEQEGPGGKDPVPVGVNGTVIRLPRGVEIDVPYRYYLALKNAVRTVHDPISDKPGEFTTRNVPAYAYQTLSMPTPAEIETFHKRSQGCKAA